MKKLTFLLLTALLAAMSQAAITYVDANFTAGTGNTLYAPSAGGGTVTTNTTDTADGIWRYRTGFGLSPSETALPTTTIPNGGSGTIYESTGNVSPSDDVRRVVTTVSVPQNAYDVYVYFWMDQSGSPWRIRAGLEDTLDPLELFIGSNTFTPDSEPISWVGTDANGRRLLQAYIGQASGSSISVYVEDQPAANGNERTWYDGIGYVKVYNRPNSPSVTPDNGNGTVGTLVNNDTQAEVTLHFNAGADPNYPVNPDILGHYIYLSNSPTDPNLSLLDYIVQVHNADPMLTDPANSYGPITLDVGVTYYWQVEEAVDNGTGTPFGAGDPNNFVGPIWSFTTISPACTISPVDPPLAAVNAGSNAVLSVTGTNIVNYQWWKIGVPDVQLSNDSKFSGVTTGTLTITDVQLADEATFYCVVSNDVSTASNRDTGPGRVMIKRRVNYYPMEAINSGATPDDEGDADMTLYGGPVLSTNSRVGTYSLDLNSSSSQFGQLTAGFLDYTDFTLMAWVYWRGGLGFQRIFDFGYDATHRVALTPNSWGSSTAFVIANSTSQSTETFSLLPQNQWVHVAVSLNGNTGRLYINGELRAINTGMTHDPIDFGTTYSYIGRSLDAAEPYLNGLIDDLMVYNAALTNTEIAQYVLAITGGEYICDTEGSDTLEFDFNDDCRVTLADFAEFVTEWLNDNRIY